MDITSLGELKKMALYLRLLMFITFSKLSCQGWESCSSTSNCPEEYVCCGHSCILGSDCQFSPCTLDSDCNGLYCCDYQCLDSCVFCDSDADCRGPNSDNCCSNLCQREKCPLPIWALLLIVFASVTAFIIILVVCGCCCEWCDRRSIAGDVIVHPPKNPAHKTTVVAGSTVNYGTVYPTPNDPPPSYSSD